MSKQQMKVGVTLYSYRDLYRQGMTVEEAIEHAASCGAKCIETVDQCNFLEWPHPKLADLFRIKDLIESLGMEWVNWSQYTEEEYSADYRCTEDDLVDQVKESIFHAYILGIPVTRITPLPNVDPAKNRVIERCLPFAEKYNVIMGFEIHSPQKPDSFIQLMKQFNSKYLSLVPDYSAWSYAMNLPLDSFRECLPYTDHIHGKAHAIISEGGDEPNIPYKDLMTVLKDSNYTGSIVAEYEPREHDTDVKKGVESLVKYIYSFVE